MQRQRLQQPRKLQLQAEAAARQPPATRSIIEGMLLPDTTAFATEFMTKSWGYNQGSSGADMPTR